MAGSPEIYEILTSRGIWLDAFNWLQDHHGEPFQTKTNIRPWYHNPEEWSSLDSRSRRGIRKSIRRSPRNWWISMDHVGGHEWPIGRSRYVARFFIKDRWIAIYFATQFSILVDA